MKENVPSQEDCGCMKKDYHKDFDDPDVLVELNQIKKYDCTVFLKLNRCLLVAPLSNFESTTVINSLNQLYIRRAEHTNGRLNLWFCISSTVPHMLRFKKNSSTT